MLGALKDWIEGLFRPVISITDRGTQYIQRTPTYWDIGIPRYVNRSFSENSASLTVIQYIQLSPNPTIVHNIGVIETGCTAMWASIVNIPSTLNVDVETQFQVIPTPTAGYPYNLLTNNIPVYVPGGWYVAIGLYNGGGGARTATTTVTYREV